MTNPPRRRNVAKLLARLNPKLRPMEFTGAASTAASREDAIDIAGALGLAGQQGAAHRLAVIALCLRWWPALIEGPQQVIGRIPVRRQFTVASFAKGRRGRERREFTEHMPVEAAVETPAMRRMASLVANLLQRRIQIDRAAGVAAALDDALTARVLAADFLGPWARLVIHEYRHPNHCPKCQGTGRPGEVPQIKVQNGKAVGVDWLQCDNCTGQGVMSWSANRRAKAMKIRAVTWASHLNPHHEDALTLLRELEWRGALAVLRRLGVPER